MGYNNIKTTTTTISSSNIMVDERREGKFSQENFDRQQEQPSQSASSSSELSISTAEKLNLSASQENVEIVLLSDSSSSESDSESDEEDYDDDDLDDKNDNNAKKRNMTMTLPLIVNSKQQQKRKVVHFGSIEIREYAVIIGDHPLCKDGLPLSLDWKYNHETTIIDLQLVNDISSSNKLQYNPLSRGRCPYNYRRNASTSGRRSTKCRKLSYLERKNRVRQVSGYTERQIRHDVKKNVWERERQIALEYMVEIEERRRCNDSYFDFDADDHDADDEYNPYRSFDDNYQYDDNGLDDDNDGYDNYSYFIPSFSTVDDGCYYDSDSEEEAVDNNDDGDITNSCRTCINRNTPMQQHHKFLFDVDSDDTYCDNMGDNNDDDENDSNGDDERTVWLHHVASLQDLKRASTTRSKQNENVIDNPHVDDNNNFYYEEKVINVDEDNYNNENTERLLEISLIN